MRYLDLFAENPLVWSLFLGYLIVTTVLAYIGSQKTDGIASFAIGKGDMHPAVVGITLAASIASTATFVINPGFVYVHGLSALLHFGAAAGTGIVGGLLVLSLGFRRIGTDTKALTLPQWLGNRYASKAMTIFFAAVNLLTVMFVVLIVGAISIVMQRTLGLTNFESVTLTIGFVFSYIFLGGTYAHAYTNTLQGFIMAIIAAIIVASGFHLLAGGWESVMTTLGATDPNLTKMANPAPLFDQFPLYSSFFSVWIAGLVIGFALVSQPHILIKVLYVDSDEKMWKSLGVCIAVFTVFTALLLVGFYAHLMQIPVEQFMDPATGTFDQDSVLTVYVTEAFSPTMVAIIAVALLSAGMSTLDGILIALSSIAANDLFLNLTEDNLLADKSDEQKSHIAHRAGQVILIAMGITTFVLALNPPELLGIFGQLGVYGIIAASAVPILGGILFKDMGRKPMFAAAFAGLGVHLDLYLLGMWAAQDGIPLTDLAASTPVLAWVLDTHVPLLGFANPAVTATWGIFASIAVATIGYLVYPAESESADAVA